MTKLYKQIGDQVIEFSDADYAQLEADNLEALKLKAENEAKIAARAEVLKKLGLTDDEVTVLLG